MNKLKAIWWTVLVVFLYYWARPVVCVSVAALKAGLLNKQHFLTIFREEWEHTYPFPAVYWYEIRRLWDGEVDEQN